MTEDQLRQIAAQLRAPSGEDGLKMAELMHESNIAMTMAAIDALNLQDKANVLEIGHGNCAHLDQLLCRAEGIQYHGLDISDLMYNTAKKLHADKVSSGIARFSLYNGRDIPSEDNSFDAIFTVNTIYFWNGPGTFLRELHRILKPGSLLCIAFGQASYMEKLPFTPFGFELYDDTKIRALFENSGFDLLASETFKDFIFSKTGEPIERVYSVVRFQKQG